MAPFQSNKFSNVVSKLAGSMACFIVQVRLLYSQISFIPTYLSNVLSGSKFCNFLYIFLLSSRQSLSMSPR